MSIFTMHPQHQRDVERHAPRMTSGGGMYHIKELYTMKNTRNMENTRTCRGACGATKNIDIFEVTLRHSDGTVKSRRRVCKPCYALVKAEKAKAKNATIDRTTVPKPSACAVCNRSHPVVQFQWRMDIASGGWRSVCDECHREQYDYKDYNAKSRARRRAADEEAYLKCNAAAQAGWARRNPDRIAEQQRLQKTVPERRWKALLACIRHKHGDEWEQHVRLEEERSLTLRFSEPCHYCGYEHVTGDDLHYLDRVDAGGPYSLANTVPCCGVCNVMKRYYSTDEFIAAVRRVVAFRGDAASTMLTSERPRSGGDVAAPAVGDKPYKMTSYEELDLCAGLCHLCGRAPALGIDRIDSTGEYVTSNCRPCCVQCIHMKKDSTLEAFLGHMARIDARTSTLTLSDFSGASKPVAVLNRDASVCMLFPSVTRAATLLGLSPSAISQAIGSRLCCGRRWRYATLAEYNSQSLSHGAVSELILDLRRSCGSCNM